MPHEISTSRLDALLAPALRQALNRAGIRGEVYRNRRPRGFSGTPDFTAGASPDEPTHVIVVLTERVGAIRLRQLRQLHLLFEAKATLPGPPRVLLISMGSLPPDQPPDPLYDAVVEVSLPLPGEGGPTTEGPQAEEWIAAMAARLAEALPRVNPRLEQLWSLMREDAARERFRLARRTSLRPGLAKLLLFDRPVREQLYASFKRSTGVPAAALPPFATELAYFARTLGGWRLVDPDLRATLELLSPGECERLLERAAVDLKEVLEPLRELPFLPAAAAYVAQELGSLSEPATLAERLLACRADPEAFAREQGLESPVDLHRNWLFTTLLELLRLVSARRAGFNYTEVVRAIAERGGGEISVAALSAWAEIQPGAELLPDAIAALAGVLAAQLARLSPRRAAELAARVTSTSLEGILEGRVLFNPRFEPLRWLLEERIGPLEVPETVPCPDWLHEYFRSPCLFPAESFHRLDGLWLRAVTLTGAAIPAKRDELAATARGVRYQYLPEQNVFVRRPGIRRLALVVDGGLSQGDVEVLARAGWDPILYPDELDQLPVPGGHHP